MVAIRLDASALTFIQLLHGKSLKHLPLIDPYSKKMTSYLLILFMIE